MIYMICEGYGVDELVKEVNKALAEGCKCQGGICATSENEEYSAKYFQAMIKE